MNENNFDDPLMKNHPSFDNLDISIKMQYISACPCQLEISQNKQKYCAITESHCSFQYHEHQWTDRYICNHVLTMNLLDNIPLTSVQLIQKKSLIRKKISRL